jgi:carboxypeptidase C (cathepsin A)
LKAQNFPLSKADGKFWLDLGIHYSPPIRLIFATESYGGHMAPVFIAYFNSQNALIDRGELSGQKIIFTSLMINKLVRSPHIGLS